MKITLDLLLFSKVENLRRLALSLGLDVVGVRCAAAIRHPRDVAARRRAESVSLAVAILGELAK